MSKLAERKEQVLFMHDQEEGSWLVVETQSRRCWTSFFFLFNLGTPVSKTPGLQFGWSFHLEHRFLLIMTVSPYVSYKILSASYPQLRLVELPQHAMGSLPLMIATEPQTEISLNGARNRGRLLLHIDLLPEFCEVISNAFSL
ncbi:hypothetical protein Tco_1420090 [Tanacetum coccineum]